MLYGFAEATQLGLFDAPKWYFAAIVLLCASILAFVFMRVWYFARRRIIRQNITARYECPLDLDPAEISYLFRRELDQRDFAGLLVHMSQRGIIHFRKHEDDKIVLPGPKYEATLKSYEKLILDTVEDHKPLKSKDLLEHYETMFQSKEAMGSFTQQVRFELIKSRHIRKKSILRRSIVLIKSMSFWLFCVLWLPLILLWAYRSAAEGSADTGVLGDLLRFSVHTSILLLLPVLALIVFVKFLQARSSGRNWIIEPRIIDFWPQIISYRQFVYLAERGKLQFESSTLQKANLRNTLPFAIAFGFVKNWREIVV